MANPITSVKVSQTLPPAPNTLQRTGAFISQGATTTAQDTLTLITQLSDLTTILTAPQAVSSITWSSGTATVTTTLPHGYPVGSGTINLTLAGFTPIGYNGTFACTITTTTEFTFALAVDPGAVTVEGTVIAADVARLNYDVTNFFAQGAGNSVYILELGVGTTADGVTTLTAFLTANPGTIYAFLVPPTWDSEAAFLTLIASYESITAKLYFFVTTTTATYSRYTALMKDVMWMVNAPTAPATEPSSIVGMFWQWIYNQPSSSNPLAPMNCRYVYGLTPWTGLGNNTILTEIYAAGGNYIGSGAEGGISNAIIRGGFTADGQQANYWYAIDWVQINLDLDISNAVINGSNNQAAPLLYNQAGINTLQSVAVSTMQNAQTYGLSLGNVITTQLSATAFAATYNAGQFVGQTVVNADPFLSYSAENPTHYKIGQYNGISVIFTPQLGFEQIVINVNATEVV